MSPKESMNHATGADERRVRVSDIVVLAATLVIVAAVLEWPSMAAVRSAAVGVIAAQAWRESGTSRRLFVTSPAFLLAAACVVFYSFLPAVLTPVSGAVSERVVVFFGSQAERYVIIFAMAALLAHSWASRGGDHRRDQQAVPPPVEARITNLLMAASVVLTVLDVVAYFAYPQGAPYVTAGRALIPPLQAFVAVYLLRRVAAAGWGPRVLALLVIAAAVLGMLAAHERKIPVFIVVAGTLYWFRLRQISIGKTFIGVVAAAAVVVAMLQAAQAIRSPENSVLRSGGNGESASFMFRHVLDAKLVSRQVDTGACFLNVVKAHWQEPFVASKQLFWLEALVPRVAWPEKPSLSLGRDYSTRFCGFLEKNQHSASITLLGQPVIQGGWIGLLLHGGLLIFALAGLARLSRIPGSLSSTTVAALLPWLIDFDQDFALYVANAVKFFLVMSPLVLIAGLSEKNEIAWRLAGRFGFRMR